MITPLKCITSFASELQKSSTTSENDKFYSSLIKNTSKLLYVHVNELLDKTLIDKNMVVAKLEEVSLIDLIVESISIMSQ